MDIEFNKQGINNVGTTNDNQTHVV